MAWSASKRLLFACLLVVLFALGHHFSLLQRTTGNHFLESNMVQQQPCSHPPEGVSLVGAYGRVANSELIISPSFRAEILFSQGMAHYFAFNHIESYRNFEAALLFDNQCSLCYWGMALVSGPNLNAALDEEHYLRGRGMINAAIESIDRQHTKNKTSSPYVRKSTTLMTLLDKAYDLIHALKLRYPDSLGDWKLNGFLHYEKMYADAMQVVHEKYPADTDITAMYAEAVMNLSPWNVFRNDSLVAKDTMNGNSLRAYSILSKALYPQELMPISISQINKLGSSSQPTNHPLLLHLWIHLMESGSLRYVQAAESQADLLWTVAVEPTGKRLGHLLHMPAHIYDNLGRYDDCITVSTLAIESDRAYSSSCFTPAYDIHNQDILVSCAVMGGRVNDAMTYAILAGALLVEAQRAKADGTTALRPYHYTLAMEFIAPHFGEWDTLLSAKHISEGEPIVAGLYSDLDIVFSKSSVPYSRNAVSSSRENLENFQNQHPFLFAVCLYGRALALINRGEIANGEAAASMLEKTVVYIPAATGIMASNNYNYRRDIGRLLVTVVRASLFLHHSKSQEAITILREGVRLQNSFGYREPAPFYLPLRQCLAAALVHHSLEEESNDLSTSSALRNEAQNLFHEDLIAHPHNVWSMRGQKYLSALSLKSEHITTEVGDTPLKGVSSCCEIGLC